jgi:cysteine desulfurase/selenocysteine lyase
VASIRRDFPILNERIHGRRLVWLDNGATTQKPQVVIDRISTFYERENSNIHRAAHTLAGRATDAYEGARESVRRFLNAGSTAEIVFARGATEAINLVAWTWGKQNLRAGDEIVLSWLEHHANIVPWHRLAAETGARILVAPVDDRGDLHVEDVQRLLGPRTRLVSVTQVSNALGTVTPVHDIVEAAHRYGAKVLIDGAQAVSHLPVDVQDLDCDFYVFSGHKVFAPTGIGALFGKADVLEGMPPYQGGGNMISDVTFERITYQPPPGRFEAGTGSIADAVGLGAALDYVQRIGRENISAHEHALMDYLLEGLKTVPGLRTIGAPTERAGVVSFVIDGYRSEDIGSALDKFGIAVRAGHYCAQPILRRFGLESTVRPSLALYNSYDDVDVLTDALKAITRGRTLAPVV